VSDQASEKSVVAPEPVRARRSSSVPLAIGLGTAAVLAAGGLLFSHAQGSTNQVALASQPKPVTVVQATAAKWKERRRYIGTIEPWVSAQIGPQFVSAYVATVRVRPGASVSRGQIIATLDCRNTSSTDQAMAAQARAVETSQTAIAAEAARISTLLKGGFASTNEMEMKQAESDSKQAQLLALKAQLQGSSLQVQDCVLRAPFDGEIADRSVDPGAFVRPGTPIATVIDRSVVRVTAEVPEADFEAVAPGVLVRLHLLATGADLQGRIARRAPAADLSTRTVHLEIDLPNPDRSVPVGTTAELRLEAGQAIDTTELPLAAATVRGARATVVVVEDGIAHLKQVPVRGESEGELFLDPELKPGSAVVLQGRNGVAEGDTVATQGLPDGRVGAL